MRFRPKAFIFRGIRYGKKPSLSEYAKRCIRLAKIILHDSKDDTLIVTPTVFGTPEQLMVAFSALGCAVQAEADGSLRVTRGGNN